MSVVLEVPGTAIAFMIGVVIASELGATPPLAGGVGLVAGATVLTIWLTTDWLPRGKGPL